jgi:hypothetical protein
MDLDHVWGPHRRGRRWGGGVQQRPAALCGACCSGCDPAAGLVAQLAAYSTKCRAARRTPYVTSRELTHRRPFAARLAAATTAHHIRGQPAALARHARDDRRQPDRRAVRRGFRLGPTAGRSEFPVGVRASDRTGRPGCCPRKFKNAGRFRRSHWPQRLVTIRDFLPHLLLAWSPEIEPPQQNSPCIATPCSIASNGSRS